MKLLKRVTKTANSRGNESRIAKQDSKKFPRIVETANGKPANGEGCLYMAVSRKSHREDMLPIIQRAIDALLLLAEVMGGEGDSSG